MVKFGLRKGMMAFALAGVACSPSAARQEEPVFTPSTLPYPFSDAVQVGDILFLSGDVGLAEDGQTLATGGMEVEARRVMVRLGERLAAHDLTYKDVIKCTVMLADMSDWPTFNGIYAQYFEKPYPTRSAMGVNGLALGARVELECWAHSPAKRSGVAQ